MIRWCACFGYAEVCAELGLVRGEETHVALHAHRRPAVWRAGVGHVLVRQRAESGADFLVPYQPERNFIAVV